MLPNVAAAARRYIEPLSRHNAGDGLITGSYDVTSTEQLTHNEEIESILGVGNNSHWTAPPPELLGKCWCFIYVVLIRLMPKSASL